MQLNYVDALIRWIGQFPVPFTDTEPAHDLDAVTIETEVCIKDHLKDGNLQAVEERIAVKTAMQVVEATEATSSDERPENFEITVRLSDKLSYQTLQVKTAVIAEEVRKHLMTFYGVFYKVFVVTRSNDQTVMIHVESPESDDE